MGRGGGECSVFWQGIAKNFIAFLDAIRQGRGPSQRSCLGGSQRDPLRFSGQKLHGNRQVNDTPCPTSARRRQRWSGCPAAGTSGPSAASQLGQGVRDLAARSACS